MHLYGFYPGVILLRYSDAPVNYRAIDWGLSFGYQCKSVAILDSGYYE